ncbi:MAG TPA: AAA family ATPase, partial [Ktedonobacteraceae bacterium]
NVRTLKIELTPHYESSLQHTLDMHQRHQSFSLYQQIQDTMQKLQHLGVRNPLLPSEALTEIASNLGLLQEERHNDKKRELYLAKYKYEMREYKDALAILLRLREQWVQQYWDQPLRHLGHIRNLDFGDVQGNPIDEIIVGTDEGRLIAIDINKEQEERWQPRPKFDSSIVALQCANPHQDGYEVTIAVLEDGSIRILDNAGRTLPLPDHVLHSGDRVSSLYTTTEYIAGSHHLKEVIVGLENRKIYVYRALFAERLATIPTEHSVRMLYACDVTGNGQTDILAGASNYAVYLYGQDEQDPASYKELWHFQAEDRIRALYATDIDKDGNIEILIGSEDRNLYVLNHLGQLKWRYFMPDSVLSVDAYDIDNDEHHQREVLAGVADGFVYIFNAQGDLRKKMPVHDRVRVVRAKDLHSPYYPSYADGFVEIVVATDDRLQLLQVLPSFEINEMIDRCWRYILNNANYREILHTYADHRKEDDEYIRAFAVARLAGQKDHTAEDFAVLQKAVTEDPSLIVLEALTRAVVNLFHTAHAESEIFRQARKLLHRLSLKPYLETRVTIVNMLHKLADIDPDLSFVYLEGFLSNVDLWLRHMVVRQLYHLAEQYPERVFDLLTISAYDEHRWIRQETGRSLARYFDCHTNTLFSDLHQLFGNGIDPTVTEQVAVSSEKPAIKHFFSALTDFLREIKADPNSMPLEMPQHNPRKRAAEAAFTKQKKHNEAELDKFTNALQAMMQTNPQAEDTLVIYQELQNLLRVKTIDDIEQFRRHTSPEEFQAFDHFRHINVLIEELLQIVNDVKRYRKRQVFSDQAASLIEVIFHLRGIFFRYVEDRQHISSSQTLSPEDALIHTTLQQWYTILRQELRFMRGTAELLIETTSDEIQREDTVDLFFQLRNVGRCAADNVRVRLIESKDFDIVSAPECRIAEISSQHPAIVSFTIKPFLDSFLVETDVTYTDAEHLNRPLKRRHNIDLKKAYREFKEIPNPYHGGTPISSDGNMFYGREEDLRSLREVLSSTTSTANRIILLIGQRRSGKTSLIYQLETKLNPHVAVHIDLQTFAMSNNTADLFSKLAHAIHDTLHTKGFTIPDINEQDFSANPTQSLNRYLDLVTQQLDGLRLILLIDEFEVFNQLIQDQRLDANFLHYLRSLMQHRLGINFLLAGAPRILLNDLNNRSAFLNIAQHHHLSRLEREEAEQLIVDPVSSDLTYDPIALERMHNLTGDQPYLIHLLSEALIYNCNQRRKNYANTNDVNIALDTALERGQNFFGLMWGLTSSPIERLLLSLMAQEDIDERQVKTFSLADLREAFDDLGLLYKSEQVQSALLHLKQEELIEEDSDGHLFTVPAGLMRAWLRQCKAPERVVREELVALESAD